MKVAQILGREIVDSRGFPTVWARVITQSGKEGAASVPSGASVGSREALELRDNDASRLGGKGVLTAVSNINGILASALEGKEFSSQADWDRALIAIDGTENKERLGANAILALSMAGARAMAAESGEPLYTWLRENKEQVLLPVPMMNILNGGVHASNNVDIQEFMIVPDGASSFREALFWGMEVYHALKSELRGKGLSTAVGDEGGFAPDLKADEAALDLLVCAIERAGLRDRVHLALDAASSEWYEGKGRYRLPKSERTVDRESLAEYWARLARDYPIVSLEDGMAEDDWEGFSLLTRLLPIQLVGDDLFVTNPRILKEGIDRGIANSILIKLNQIGTVSQAAEAARLAMRNGYTAVVSHRSGETEDPFLADFAVALGAGQVKTGAPARGERTAKYNRLIHIEAEENAKARFATPFLEKQHG